MENVPMLSGIMKPGGVLRLAVCGYMYVRVCAFVRSSTVTLDFLGFRKRKHFKLLTVVVAIFTPFVPISAA